jgi:hypothetical protein
MKKLLSLFFLILFVAPLVMKVFVMGHYFVELEAYKERCENRAQPELKCNGSCQFAKELMALESEQEPQIPESLKLEWAPFVLVSLQNQAKPAISISENNFPSFPNPYTAPAIDFFGPPPILMLA